MKASLSIGGLRCWQGCMAVIIECPDFPENVGAFVTVEEYLGAFPEYGPSAVNCWRTTPKGAPLHGCVHDTGELSLFARNMALPDAWLQPIQPRPREEWHCPGVASFSEVDVSHHFEDCV